MELSQRKIKILNSAIEEFIKDSAPITSMSVKDKTSLDVSTATLRNELNALEAMGFLKQLHTSGGRVPTAQGYRFYVENLLKDVKATNGELEEVKRVIENRTQSLADMISKIAKIISKATNYPTVVMMNGIENLILTEFKIIPLLDEKCMVLIGTNYGYVSETMDFSATIENCHDASNYLTKYFKGETMGYLLDNIDEYMRGMSGEIKAFQGVVNNIIKGLSKLNKQKLLNVQTDGMAKLVDKDDDIKETKKIIKMLSDKDELIEVLDKTEDKISADVTEDLSVIKAPIMIGGNKLASIGVIGPQKMDYSGIASALKVVIDELNKRGG